MTKPTVCIDFDGVLNLYTGWQGEDELFEPRRGAAEFLTRLAADYRVIIYTSRDIGKVWNWLQKHGLVPLVENVTSMKVPAQAYVDDRAIRFTGDYEQALQDIRTLRPHRQRSIFPEGG